MWAHKHPHMFLSCENVDIFKVICMDSRVLCLGLITDVTDDVMLRSNLHIRKTLLVA